MISTKPVFKTQKAEKKNLETPTSLKNDLEDVKEGSEARKVSLFNSIHQKCLFRLLITFYIVMIKKQPTTQH